MMMCMAEAIEAGPPTCSPSRDYFFFSFCQGCVTCMLPTVQVRSICLIKQHKTYSPSLHKGGVVNETCYLKS